MRIWKPKSMTHQLIVGTAVMVGFTLLLSITIIGSFYDSYKRSEANLAALRVYRQVLVAANVLSAERGPTNAVLGEEPSPDSPSRKRLDEFRQQSDAALEALEPSHPGATAISAMVPPDELRSVRASLAAARGTVDALAAKPRAERSIEDIRAVIDNMFGVVDRMQPIVTTSIDVIVSQDDSLSGVVLMAQLFSDMREFAGRVGSYVMPAVAAHQPLDQSSIARFREANGRLHEIWHLAGSRAGFYSNDPALTAARNDITTRYFEYGLPLINSVLQRGRSSGEYGVTTAELTNSYVATMAPIERMRVAFLEQTIERPKQVRATALQWLIYVSVVAALIIAANGAIIYYVRQMIFRPLIAAADEIVTLSEGKEVFQTAGEAPHGDELSGLFNAIGALRARLQERLQYTEQLRVHADTDGLTGLANRRLLDRIGSGDEEFANMSYAVGIIMLDIDHFKQINDRFGHPAGDEVLRRVADVLRTHSRRDDVAARYGGEEFTLCLTSANKRVLLDRAESIRRAIEAMRITLEDGQQFGVTASFGISSGTRGPVTWPEIISAADQALYEAKSLGRNRVCKARGRAAASAVA